MPAKTKKINRSARSTRSSVKKKSSAANFRSKSFFNSHMWLAVMAIAVVGAFAIFRANAATTNFEAESASTKTSVTVKTDDPTASKGSYAQFASTAPVTSAVPQRFPGDPNPKVTGKAYWGADELDNTNFKARFEDPTQTSMSTVRRFYDDWGDRTKVGSQATTDLAANRLPMYSIKPVGWLEMASGRRDAEIDNMLLSLDKAGGPVWLIVHHEPDGGGGCKCGPRQEDDPSGAAGWVKMQQKFRERIQAKGIRNVALMAAMTGGWGSDLNQPKDNWWVGDGVMDAWFIDHYQYDIRNQAVAAKGDWVKFAAWAENKKLPYGTAELGIRSGGADGVGFYKPVLDGPDEKDDNAAECARSYSLVPRGISAELDKQAGFRLREFWNWGRNNNKDVIAHAYFDKCINSGASPYALGGEQLTVFKDILKNDRNVQRVKDLGANTTSNFGTIAQSISVPTTGNYKLWIRMKAADSTNNTVQVQVDAGTKVRVGGTNVSTTDWTWVGTDVSLSGSNTITLTGIQKSVKVDRIIATNETCPLPTGTGENCLTVSPPPNPDPEPTGGLNIGIVTPSPNAIVSGPTKVTVGCVDIAKVDEVRFRLNDQWQFTDPDPNFEWTVTLPQGEHVITIRAQRIGDPGTTVTEKSVRVTSTNGTTPVPEPKDITAPSKPANLRASLTFDVTKMRYTMPLTWTASTDDSGEAPSYVITRNGNPLGTSKTNGFTDSTTLNSGSSYQYTVTAKDAVGNPSQPASLNVKVDCFLIFCGVSTI